MLTLRVVDKVPLTDQILGIKLESASGEVLPAIEAGAHINLHLGKGLSRQYSLVTQVLKTHTMNSRC
jgi:vanillate O-demethylase ferredoxin subunit